MLRYCPDKKDQSVDYTRKQKADHQVFDSEAVNKALQVTGQVMDLIEKEKIGAGKEEKSGSEDEELASLVDEDESLQGDNDSVDASENNKSTKDMECYIKYPHKVSPLSSWSILKFSG